jgi:hypothetical protein
VPKFVHRLSEVPIFTTRSSPASWSQGAPRCHPDVTLRLETPVLYFYPQSGFPLDRSFDVRATFVGGWLTEFFPAAVAKNPGFPRDLAQSAQGSIQWKALRLVRESEVNLPDTAERVWLAPRNVKSAVVFNENGAEAEKYLFYRGVGHLDAPIIVRKESASVSISLRNEEKFLSALPRMWIVHVSADGQLAYRSIKPGNQRTATAALPTANRAPNGLAALRLELKAALTAAGLYEDEAEAMLATWQLSYFDSEGMRVFFVLPRSWTDARLPLSTSIPAELTRVMLGRVGAHQFSSRGSAESSLRAAGNCVPADAAVLRGSERAQACARWQRISRRALSRRRPSSPRCPAPLRIVGTLPRCAARARITFGIRRRTSSAAQAGHGKIQRMRQPVA